MSITCPCFAGLCVESRLLTININCVQLCHTCCLLSLRINNHCIRHTCLNKPSLCYVSRAVVSLSYNASFAVIQCNLHNSFYFVRWRNAHNAILYIVAVNVTNTILEETLPLQWIPMSCSDNITDLCVIVYDSD